MTELTNYTLGSLPWSEEVLRKAYFQDFTGAQKAIQKHPGFAAHRDLHTLQLSLEIFLDSVVGLFQSIDAFRMDAQSPEFWARPAENRFKSRELAVRRGVFAAATSAVALVKRSFIVRDRVKLNEEYARQLKETIDLHDCKFIEKLREYVSHFQITEVDWQRTYSADGKQTQFLLRRDVLLQWDGWNKEDRVFIDRYPDGIDVKRLFINYRTCVERFQAWFHGEVARISEPQLSEYREYERILKGFGTRAWWNLILERVAIEHLDPFTFLDRYLTKSELDEVLALPRKSRVQIDRIIEILDEYGSCDEELRGKVYRSFGISSL
jgi:hypothetical protein